MQVKQLWETPKESWNGCSDIEFEFDGSNAKLIISYLSNKVCKKITVNFSHTICYKHETNYLFMPNSDTYEHLSEILNSEWVKNLENFSPNFPSGDFKHFVLDNQNDGRFEIIAESYNVE